MNRMERITSVLRVASLLLLVVAAGCEQILNHYLLVPAGTWILRASIVLLTALFLLQLLFVRVRGWRRLLPWAGFLLITGLPILYYWNASHLWRPGVGLVPVPYRALLPAGAYPPGSLVSVWLAFGVASALGTAVLLRTKQREVVLGVLVAVAFMLAVWVLCQRAIPRRYPIYEWTGWFVNRNHFAAFACLLFPVTFATGLRIQRRAFYAGKLSSPAIMFYLAAGVLAFSIVESRSRAGMAILGLQSLALLTGYGCHLKGLVGRLWKIRVLFGILLVASLFGFAFTRGNWSRLPSDLGFRGQVVQDTLSMWQANPWWGTGPRSYSVVFPYYQSASLHEHYFHYAHNDPVQMLAEWGVLGVALLLLGVLLLLQTRHDAPRHIPVVFGSFCMECFGFSLALGGVLLHSLVDFPLQHTHILLLTAVWLGMLARICRKNPGELAA